MSPDDTHAPSLELRHHDTHTDDTPTRLGYSTLKLIDPRYEVYERSKGWSKGTDDFNNHEAPAPIFQNSVINTLVPRSRIGFVPREKARKDASLITVLEYLVG